MTKMSKGFTLIELLTVMFIIAILFVVALPKFEKLMNKDNTNIPFYEIYNNGSYTYSIRGNVILDSNDKFVGIEFNEVSK